MKKIYSYVLIISLISLNSIATDNATSNTKSYSSLEEVKNLITTLKKDPSQITSDKLATLSMYADILNFTLPCCFLADEKTTNQIHKKLYRVNNFMNWYKTNPWHNDEDLELNILFTKSKKQIK